MVLSLIEVAKGKGESERIQAYWNAYHCLNKLVVSDDKMYGSYCKNLFCTICNAIGKADTINRYYPVISQWPDVHFATLTIKSCKEGLLNDRMRRMLKAFDLIHNRCKKDTNEVKGLNLLV